MVIKEINAKDKTYDTSPDQKLYDFMREIRAKCGIDFDDSAIWRNKMMIATNQRLGVKRYSTFPYPGAPDIPLPETDKLIKKSIANYVLSAWSPKNPVVVHIKQGVQERPEYKDKAKKAQSVMNMLIRSPELGWFKKLMLAADNIKQYGYCIFKIYEEFRTRAVHKVIDTDEYDSDTISQLKSLTKTELVQFLADRYNLDPEDETDKKSMDDAIDQLKSGDTIIEFDVQEIVSMPQVDIVMPTMLNVPSHTTEINKAVRIKEVFFLAAHEIERLMEDGVFVKKDFSNVPKYAGADQDIIEVQKSRNEGVSDNTSGTDLYKIEMICCWFKESESDLSCRKIFTFFADESDPKEALLQNIDFPYEFDGWFYEKHDNELRDKRFYNSRGVPEQIRAMQEIMERCINNMIIRDEMSNTPIWEVLDTSEIMDTHISITPGMKLSVRQLGTEIRQLNEFPKNDTASQQIMVTLKAYTEEYLSVNDQLFRNATNMGGGKTLGEIQQGVQQNAGPINLEVIGWNETLSRVYTKMFQILAERLGESIWVDGNEVTKEDFNFPADVRSNGDLDIANEQLSTQKAWMRLSAILNPALAEVVTPEDKYNAIKDWLEKDGVKDPDQFCTNPMQVLQDKMRQMQQQLMQMQQQGQMQAKQLAQQRMAGAEAEQDLKANQELGNELGMANMQEVGTQVGEAVGNELLAGASAGAGQ